MSFARMIKYTTEDEIEFLRELERAGKRQQLRAYRKSIPYRTWRGLGMEVDRSRIEAELGRILGRESLEEKRESYQDFVVRVAGEWLAGGQLRRIVQERAVNDEMGDGVPDGDLDGDGWRED